MTSGNVIKWIEAPPLPIEVVELIIDKVPDGQTFIACSLVCKKWLARCRYYLFRRISVASGGCGEVLPYLAGPSKAGHFVQSLVIKETSPDLLGAISSAAADNLMNAVPNVRELQMFGVTEWALEHFLDPLSHQIEDLTLFNVRARNWAVVRDRIARCSSRLRCLRISSLHYTSLKSASTFHKTSRFNPNTPIAFSLPHLERIAIDSESASSLFANDLLEEITLSGSTDHIEVVELPLPFPSKILPFLAAVGSTLTHLTIHCDTLRPTQEMPKHLNLNINSCKNLITLHVLGIPSFMEYGTLALTALVAALKRFPYSTLRTIQIASRTTSTHLPFRIEDWWALDDALSSPHLASLERLEIAGMFGITNTLGKLLPQTHARRIVRLLG